jgi:biotin transport system substrate-specific component
METQTKSTSLIEGELIRNISRMALFAALMGAFSFVSFPNPLSPAPVTLQVVGVFLAGIMLGPAWGTGALALYLLAGAVGAPVFAGGSAGIGVLLGPTAGYLWSYPLAAGVTGLVVHQGISIQNYREASVPLLVSAMVIATALIYAMGVGGMMVVLGLSPVEAFLVGAAAFIPAEAFKIAAVVGIVHSDDIAIAG